MAYNSYSRQYGRMSRGVMLPPPRKDMTKTLVTLGLAGLGAFAIYKLVSTPDEFTLGKSGHKWRVIMRGRTPAGVTEWEVFAPAGSWGPHGELSVLRYTQSGSDMSSRKLVGTGAGVPPEMVTGAKSDFGLASSSGALPLGTSG